MGVPGFFAWLLKRHKKSGIIRTDLDQEINTLYIDTNCLIHPQCFKVLGFFKDGINVEKLERKMFKRIFNYIDYLIAHVRPKEEVYIAIDGVAPCAKINQQRKRRFKSTYDAQIYGEIKKRHGKNSADIWSNTCITPGTEFMERLHQEFLKYVKADRLKMKIKYTYSSYHEPGEGEHKILQDIKIKNDPGPCVIYGLDADLIFLALASGKDNIYLLREEAQIRGNDCEKEEIINIVTDVGEDLNFVSMDETKKSINDQINNIIVGKGKNESNYNFTNDFIFMCYFLGNDFLPNIPSIEIKNDGMDFILDNFTEVYLTLGCGIMNGKEINHIFLGLLLENLAKFEDYYFKVKYPKWMEILSKRSCPSDDPYEKDIWNIDNMRSFKDINHDNIKLGEGKPDVWKFRYYEHYYGTSIYQKEHIAEMCNEYIKGLYWNTLYYFDKCPSWTWYYRYINAPFVSDLVKFINNRGVKIEFKKDSNIDPFVQLLCVLPPSCHYLLPSKFGELMTDSNSPIIDMYPIKFKLDMLYKESFHKCTPILPNVNLGRIIDATKNIKLNNKEKVRNKIYLSNNI